MRMRSLAGLPIEQHSSPNIGGRMRGHRGVVLHSAEGYYRGTISWQLNPDQRYRDGTKVTTSSTWVVGRAWGEWAQMVDTDTVAWCQGDGSRDWNSIELAGFAPAPPTAWQIFACAHILTWGHSQHQWPLTVADDPDDRGLGHHSMDREGRDPQWGHDACPGPGIIAAKPAIVARAGQLTGTGEDLMTLPILRRGAEGEHVRTSQGLLLARRQQLPKHGVDGDLGSETMEAIKKAQAAAGLPVTGIVDEATWGVLLPGLAGLAQLGRSVAQLADRPAVDPVALAAAIGAELEIPSQMLVGAVETALRRVLAGLAGQ